MSTKRLIPLVLAVLAVALVAAGCGSSKKSSSTSSSSKITKAEFLRKGNAICAAGNKEINAQGKKIFGKNRKPTKAQLKQFATQVLVPSVEKQVNQIKALGAPAGDEAKVKAILDAADQGVAKGKQDPLVLVKDSGDPFKRANKLARDYGLNVCGSNSG